MRTTVLAAITLAIISSLHAAEEVPAKSGIVSVGMFKNGLAYIKRELKVPGPGTYLVDDVPEPVHGTWWVQSDAQIETRVTRRDVSEPLRTDSNVDFQKILAGRQVTVHFREGQIPPATGKVESVADGKDAAWNRSYERPRYDYWNNGYQGQPPVATPFRYLVLQTDTGRVFVDSSMIAYLKTEGKDDVIIKHKKPVLIFTADKAATITISYLTKGMAWAPNYRVDISDPKTLLIEQDAVVKNELADIEGAELQLISGFPSVHFGHVLSPLTPGTNWASFFSQLNQRFSSGDISTSNAVYQQAIQSNDVGAGRGIDLSAAPAGEGVDVYYHSIGARSMLEGDSLALTVARGKAEYQRIVEWLIPDTRNEFGMYVDEYQRRQNPDKFDDTPWDSVRFKNPFKFPMTTAPATVVSGERFNGQQMSYWVNSGEETCLHVTKALSVRTRNIEHEEEGKRDTVYIAGSSYIKTNVKCDITVNNHRKEEITIVIRRNFSGDLITADAEPKKTLREEGAYSVNTRNELSWTLVLKPGEERTLTYRYSVMVRH